MQCKKRGVFFVAFGSVRKHGELLEADTKRYSIPLADMYASTNASTNHLCRWT
jgi:hypothetical protein